MQNPVPILVVLTLAVSVTLAIADPPPERFSRISAPEDGDYYARHFGKEELGRMLFFDKILSGNRNISCASCHHPLAATGDALSLPVGEGGLGLGPTRGTGAGVPDRVPRNSPHIFNLGASEFARLFHDGRVEADPTAPGGFRSPAGAALPDGLDNVLAAQAMFPVTSGAEMAGQAGENPIADLAASGNWVGVWDALAERLAAIPGYALLFVDAFEEIASPDQIRFVHAANAIAAFESAAYRNDNSAFDRYLRGERTALSTPARHGMQLFYGKANCASCHAGAFQTDHRFYAIGMPQIGPGKGDNQAGHDDGRDDFGRERVSKDPADRFRFRVPSLRNVAVTGPWGHDGAYNDLEAMVRHHLDPVRGLNDYDPEQCVLPADEELDPLDFVVHSDPARRGAIEAAIEIEPVTLSDREIGALIGFLYALTDPAIFELRNSIPPSVPSGLPLGE